MKSKIHYEDDLFFFNLQMKLLRDGFKLNIDSDYFLDKVVHDLRFIDSGLGKILSTLRENPNLIRRTEYLHNLVKVETVYVELLDEILSQRVVFSEYLVSYFDELRPRREAHRQDIVEIRAMQRISSSANDDKQDFITPDEMALLTQVDPDSEER